MKIDKQHCLKFWIAFLDPFLDASRKPLSGHQFVHPFVQQCFGTSFYPILPRSNIGLNIFVQSCSRQRDHSSLYFVYKTFSLLQSAPWLQRRPRVSSQRRLYSQRLKLIRPPLRQTAPVLNLCSPSLQRRF